MDQELGNEVTVEISNGDASRYLLQYLLSCKGICHEYVMLLGLMKLFGSRGKELFGTSNGASLMEQLDSIINGLNIKLDPLKYKIVKVNHPIGKTETAKHIKNYIKGLLLSESFDDPVRELSLDFMDKLPESNKYYIYVNLESDKETEMATNYSPKEVECMKLFIKMMMRNSRHPKEINSTLATNTVVREIKQILTKFQRDRGDIDELQEHTLEEEQELQFLNWNTCVSYTIGSTEAASNMILTSTETENFLNTLSADKWFYRTNNGRYGLDLKGIVELQEFLKEEYGMKPCSICKQLVFQGVLCNENSSFNENEEITNLCNAWHIDCFQHYITHISQQCEHCGNNIIENSAYII